MRNIRIFFAAAVAASMAFTSGCTQESPITNPPVDHSGTEIERGTFAKGADVSWVTELEAKGYKFYNADGNQMELMKLLRDECGVNSIRLRVWVNPTEGWNNIDDVVVKARRANSLGLRVMLDFHFSDTWADPGQQAIPAAWADMDLAAVKVAMAAHVGDLLNKLSACGVEPEWVQIGNETRTGMMWPLGKLDNGSNFTEMVNAGYDAVKAVFPDALVIVHCDQGDNGWLYSNLFGTLKAQGARYDMIGMSLYPDASNWSTTVASCVSNISTVKAAYGKPVMICEVGMDYKEAAACNAMLTQLKARCIELDVKGIFYWEPEAPAELGYKKGCFVDGAPTEALDCFKD